ncbi:hypothetical protein G9A89_015944 [Geosiphon pyriformis]|nr:hypothetical protein G9A89_015944 [Geosiphon pyriformis]
MAQDEQNGSTNLANEVANSISILIATDNHLGYLERDPIRGQDSLRAFEEILKLAKENKVDMILLGGDLFHENKPSRKILYETIRLLRLYCMGDTQCQLVYLSDQSVNFPDCFSTVNYQDPNFNVSIPVFSIHGNHDDPAGFGSLAALDILAVSGYVNYFGRPQQVDNIEINPILLEKGTTKLAIYGIGHVREERLHRSLRNEQVRMMRPHNNPDEWFNLMVLHQNRAAHGPTSYIPENFLDKFLHLVLWGHEHECLIDPVYNSEQGFYITQPGSSVATSLVDGEAKPKHVAILRVKGKDYKLEKIRLQSVRPFVVDEVDLSSISQSDLILNDSKKVQKYLTNKVNDLIEKATSEGKSLNSLNDSTTSLPLIRLKVVYDDRFSVFNARIFGDQFTERVANPREILYFYRKRAPKGKAKDLVDDFNDLTVEDYDNFTPSMVEDFINDSLKELKLLPENEFNSAVSQFVDKEDVEAIEEFFKDTVQRARNQLFSRQIEDESRIQEEALREKQIRREQFNSESQNKGLSFTRPKARENDNETMELDDGKDDQYPTTSEPTSSTPSRFERQKPIKRGSRIRGAGRGARGGKTRSRKTQEYDEFDDELEARELEDVGRMLDEITTSDKPKRGRAKAPVRATRTSLRSKPPVDYQEKDEDGDNHSQLSQKTPIQRGKTKKLAQYNLEDAEDYEEDTPFLGNTSEDNLPSANVGEKRKASGNPVPPPLAPKKSTTTRSNKSASSSKPDLSTSSSTSTIRKTRTKVTIKEEELDDYFGDT